MFKQLAIVLCTGFVALLPGANSTALRGDGRPTVQLYSAVFLKPGETQQLVLSAPDFKIGAYDRTTYEFTPVNEAGEKTPPLKGITITEDRHGSGELWDRYAERCVAVKFSSTPDAELGKFLIRVHASPFGGPSNFEATVRLTVAK